MTGMTNEENKRFHARKRNEPIKDALDSLALALTDHNHVWSDELRAKYEKAIKIIENEEGEQK